MDLQLAMYALMDKLIDAIFSSSIVTIAAPALTLLFLVRFLRWSNSVAKGESENDMRTEFEDSLATMRSRGRRVMGQEDGYEERGLYQRQRARRGRRW